MDFQAWVVSTTPTSPLLAPPVVPAAGVKRHHFPAAAKAVCRQELKKKRANKCAAKRDEGNPFGKCVSSYERHHEA